MKWFQPIECDNTVKNPLVCNNDNLEQYGFQEDDFIIGKRIKDWRDVISFRATDKKHDGKPDDVLQNHLMLPIYSDRLTSELMKEEINGIQYLPIRVLRPKNNEIKGFAIANIINFVEAFNYKKSDYTRFEDDFPNPTVRGKIAMVDNFVLYKNKLVGMDIIRLKDYNQRIFISENVKTIFDKNNFTGYSFREIKLT